MWGNARGWWISFFLLAIGGCLISWVQVELQPNLTRILATEAAYTPFTPDWPHPDVVDFNEPGEVSSLYQSAAAAYNEDACQSWSLHPQGAVPPSIQSILEATHKNGTDIFLSHPEVIVNYKELMGDTAQPELTNLMAAAGKMWSAAIILKKANNLDEARRYAQSAYAMGRKLYNERLTNAEYANGMGIMTGSLTTMIDIEGEDSERGKELSDAKQALLDMNTNHVEPIHEMLSTQDPTVLEQHSGDVFAFSIDADSKERLFRDEAILKMGRYRYNAETEPDQVAASRYIDQLLADPNSDPVVRAAAQAAHDLSQVEYNQFR